jgi:hypothetical protein
MEWGLAGCALLTALFWRLLRKSVTVLQQEADSVSFAVALTSIAAFILLFVSLVFRPYFEYPDVMVVASALFLLTTEWTNTVRISAR